MLRTKLTKKNNRSYEDIHYSCTVRFLDDSEPLSVTYQKDSKGQWLLDYICKELNLEEKDYFGLRYVDQDKQRHWLDPTKTIHKQMKNVSPMVLCFRVKFYPSDPNKLKEEITRYMIFLQLRRDLHHGRLLCSPTDANELAGYIIQSEVGDYDPQDHPAGYVTQFKMLPKQTSKQEEKIAEFHRKLQGQVPMEAEANFLKKSATLETYGVDPHPVKDQKGNQMYLGVTHLGIVTFQGNKRTHLFKWPQITKIAFEGKMFIVHVIISEKKHACGFKCTTFSACKHLWKCAVEQQYFFTLAMSSEAKKVSSGGSFFSRGSKFRFSGRCQREVMTDSENITREEPAFTRSSSNPQFVRSYNNLKSASLPRTVNRSATADNINVSSDSNHTSGLDSLLAVSTPLDDPAPVDDTIPEESVLELGDSPYRPLASPEREEAPPLPLVTMETTVVTSDIVPTVTVTEAEDVVVEEDEDQRKASVSSDLDSQIEELQKELDRCRKSANGNNGGGDNEEAGGSVLDNQPPPAEQESSVEAVVEAEVEPTVSAVNTATQPVTEDVITENHVEETETTPEIPEETVTPNGGQVATEPAPPLRVKKASCCTPCRAVVLTLFITLALVVLVAALVLESRARIPVIREIRALPEVQDFKIQRYDPLRTAIAKKLATLFKKR